MEKNNNTNNNSHATEPVASCDRPHRMMRPAPSHDATGPVAWEKQKAFLVRKTHATGGFQNRTQTF
jgi:hypothetical protein